MSGDGLNKARSGLIRGLQGFSGFGFRWATYLHSPNDWLVSPLVVSRQSSVPDSISLYFFQPSIFTHYYPASRLLPRYRIKLIVCLVHRRPAHHKIRHNHSPRSSCPKKSFYFPYPICETELFCSLFIISKFLRVRVYSENLITDPYILFHHMIESNSSLIYLAKLDRLG